MGPLIEKGVIEDRNKFQIFTMEEIRKNKVSSITKAKERKSVI
jgi:hypothetical protein